MGAGNGNGNGANRTRLRPQSRETRFVKLRACASFEEVHKRILAGWPLSQVAKFLQEESQEYTDIPHDSMVTILQEYRSSIPPAQLIEKRMPPVFNKAVQKVEEGLDELKELERLFRIQIARIEIDYGIEKKLQKLVPSMTQEIRAAREILKTHADLRMDLGLAERKIGVVELDAHLSADIAGRYGNPEIGQAVVDPESRRKVLGVAKLLLEKAKRGDNVIDVEAESVNDQEDHAFGDD